MPLLVLTPSKAMIKLPRALFFLYSRHFTMYIIAASVIQFIVASMIVPYAVYLTYYTLEDFYSYKYGLWVVMSYNAVYKFATSWGRAYIKVVKTRNLEIHRRNMLITSAVLCLELFLVAYYNTPISQLFFAIIGGTCAAIITLHARFYLFRFVKRPHTLDFFEQVFKPLAFMIMSGLIKCFIEIYGIRLTQLIMSGFCLNLIPAALVFEPLVCPRGRRLEQLLKKYYRNEEEMEMQRLLNNETADANVQVEDVTNDTLAVIDTLEEEQDQDVIEMNPVNVTQTSALQDISEEEATTSGRNLFQLDETIEVITVKVEATPLIHPEEEAQVSEVLQEVKEKEPMKRVRSVSQPDEKIEVIPPAAEITPVVSPTKEIQASEVVQEMKETEPTKGARSVFQPDETIEVIPATAETTSVVDPGTEAQVSEVLQDINEQEPTTSAGNLLQPDETIEAMRVTLTTNALVHFEKNAQVSEVLQDISEKESTKSACNLFPPDKRIEVIPATVNTMPREVVASPSIEELLPTSPDVTLSEAPTIRRRDSMEYLCCTLDDWNINLGPSRDSIKEFWDKHVIIAIPSIWSRAAFYPAVFSSSLITVVSSICWTSIPYLLIMGLEELKERSSSSKIPIYLLISITSACMCFVPFFVNGKVAKSKDLLLWFMVAAGFCAANVFWLSFTYDQAHICIAFTLFGMGHTLVSYTEMYVNKNLFADHHWPKALPAIELYSAIIATFIYLMIYISPLEDSRWLLFVMGLMYICLDCIWALSYKLKANAERVKTVPTTTGRPAFVIT